jgi:hypothetical protein
MREFSPVVSATAIKPERRLAVAHIVVRVLVASLVWLAVSGLSLYVAWQNARQPDVSRDQSFTRLRLKRINESIAEFRQRFNMAPLSIAQLLAMTNGVPSSDTQAEFIDGWNRPFLFSSDGTNCLITSYGRDGKPGGVGLDCDLTSSNWKPRESLPTFQQFLHDLPTRGMIMSCLVCGGIAFLLSLFTFKAEELTDMRLLTLAMTLVATVLGATTVAVIISALHIPSGH